MGVIGWLTVIIIIILIFVLIYSILHQDSLVLYNLLPQPGAIPKDQIKTYLSNFPTASLASSTDVINASSKIQGGLNLCNYGWISDEDGKAISIVQTCPDKKGCVGDPGCGPNVGPNYAYPQVAAIWIKGPKSDLAKLIPATSTSTLWVAGPFDF